jgi:hypothetical protein
VCILNILHTTFRPSKSWRRSRRNSRGASWLPTSIRFEWRENWRAEKFGVQRILELEKILVYSEIGVVRTLEWREDWS